MSDVIDTIKNIERSGDAFAKGTFAGTKTHANGFDGILNLPKAGASAGAGVGHARAEWSIFDAEAKGPNAEAGAEASLSSLSASAFAKAEVASASASAGPLKGTVGLGVDTGVKVSPTGVEAKVLGTGVKLGRTMGVSLFGTGFEFKLW